MNEQISAFVLDAVSDFAAEVQAITGLKAVVEYTPDHTNFLLRLEPYEDEDGETKPLEVPEGHIAVQTPTDFHIPSGYGANSKVTKPTH